MKIFWIIANALAAFLDFSAGAFVVFAISLAADHHVQYYHYLLGGVVALTPDIVDVLRVYLQNRGELRKDTHKMLLHRPLVILPLGFVSVWAVSGLFWGIALTLCLSWHYLHDIHNLNLLWPFTADKKGSVQSESDDSSEKSFSKKHETWLYKWLAPNKRPLIEIVGGMTLLTIIVTKDLGVAHATAFMTLSILALSIVWNANARRKK